MAKVVLVWNEHPTEVVAGFHARKVAEILRKAPYNHEVVVEKIPVAQTGYGRIRHIEKGANPERVAQELRYQKTSFGTAAKSARKHRTFAFNFHASKHTNLGRASVINPEAFRLC